MSLSRVIRWIVRLLIAAALLVGGYFWLQRAGWDLRPTLRLYVWDGYFPDSVLNEFALRHWVNIKVKTFSTNEELLARLKVSWDEFDVVMPSNYMVEQMRRFRLLERMDDEHVPNIRNLSADAVNGHVVAPGAEYYAVPYLGNYAGIGYNKKRVQRPPSTWAEYFSLPTAATYGPRLSLLDQPRETVGLALLALGLSPNTRSPADLGKVRLLLQRQSNAGAPTFVYEDGRDLLMKGRTQLLATWSPEVAMAQESDPDIGYVMPSDGSILTVDTLAVPSSSSHQALAMEFINYLLQPKIAQRVTEYSGYFNTLRPELAPPPADLRSTPSFAVPPKGKTWVLSDVGDAQYLYDTIWAEYRTHPRSP